VRVDDIPAGALLLRARVIYLFARLRPLGNIARGLVLLFGIGTKALPSWDSN